MDLAEKSLREVMTAVPPNNTQGMLRDEMLEYQCETSEVLDLLNLKHGLPHLNVKPSNILSYLNHAKVADAGLVCDLSGLGAKTANSTGEPLTGITAPYASPETFAGRFSPSSDQYSLAIVYQELLTGTLPFDGKNPWQLTMQHALAVPNLESLPAMDRPIIARALSKDPQERYPSCLMFMLALVTGEVEPRRVPQDKLTAARLIRCLYGGGLFQGEASPTASGEADMTETPAMGREAFSKLVASPDSAVPPSGGAPQRLPPQGGATNTRRASDAVAATEEGLPAGYRFVKELGRGPMGDFWKIQAPDGSARLLKMLLFRSQDRAAEMRALEEFKNLRHPALVPSDFVNLEQSRLLIGMDLIDDSVRKRFEMYRTKGATGIPRKELLNYLRQAAETLDQLYDKTAIAHMALNPSNMLLTDCRLLLADFGLWHLFTASLPPVGQCNARYAAPESADYESGRADDQFTLAVIYQEMLTGLRPFRDRTARPSSGPAVRGRKMDVAAVYTAPDLSQLPAPDRAVVGRALSEFPHARFDTCMDFVQALLDASTDEEETMMASAETPTTNTRAVVHELYAAAVGQMRIHEIKTIRSLIRPGATLVHRCGAVFASGVTKSKLTGFGRDLNLKVVKAENDLVVYHLPLGSSFLGFGKRPLLEIQVRILKPRVEETRLMEVEMTFTPRNCQPERAAAILNEAAPALVEQLRMYLVAKSEYRHQERIPYEAPLSVAPVLADGGAGEAIPAVGKDVSLEGFSFFAGISYPPLEYLQLSVNVGSPPMPIAIPARVVRSQSRGNGWFEIGVRWLAGS
jgi:serine/threonine protein kinase